METGGGGREEEEEEDDDMMMNQLNTSIDMYKHSSQRT
jgi:hypothetical protein